jgi:hypothetical protein
VTSPIDLATFVPVIDEPPADAREIRRPDRRRWLWRAGGAVAALALVTAAITTWRVIDHDQKLITNVSGTRTQQDATHPGYVTFTDSETGFRLELPAAWSTRVAGTADVRLVAGPGGDNLMSVRVATLDTGTANPTAAGLRPYFDTIVNQPTTHILQRTKIDIDGVPGWYYVYTFKDASSGQVGVHAQYFLLRGSELFSIVFQALPQSSFAGLAPAYQQVANSIRFD